MKRSEEKKLKLWQEIYLWSVVTAAQSMPPYNSDKDLPVFKYLQDI